MEAEKIKLQISIRENKRSRAGTIFNTICKEIFRDVFQNVKDEHFKVAFRKEKYFQEDAVRDEITEDMFERELWVRRFKRHTYDCRILNEIFRTVKQLPATIPDPFPCDYWANFKFRVSRRQQHCIYHQ